MFLWQYETAHVIITYLIKHCGRLSGKVRLFVYIDVRSDWTSKLYFYVYGTGDCVIKTNKYRFIVIWRLLSYFYAISPLYRTKHTQAYNYLQTRTVADKHSTIGIEDKKFKFSAPNDMARTIGWYSFILFVYWSLFFQSITIFFNCQD